MSIYPPKTKYAHQKENKYNVLDLFSVFRCEKRNILTIFKWKLSNHTRVAEFA